MLIFILWTALAIASTLALFWLAGKTVSLLPDAVIDSTLWRTVYVSVVIALVTGVSVTLFGVGAHHGLGLTWADITL